MQRSREPANDRYFSCGSLWDLNDRNTGLANSKSIRRNLVYAGSIRDKTLDGIFKDKNEPVRESRTLMEKYPSLPVLGQTKSF